MTNYSRWLLLVMIKQQQQKQQHLWHKRREQHSDIFHSNRKSNHWMMRLSSLAKQPKNGLNACRLNCIARLACIMSKLYEC